MSQESHKFIEEDFMNSVGQEIEGRNDIPDQRVFQEYLQKLCVYE